MTNAELAEYTRATALRVRVIIMQLWARGRVIDDLAKHPEGFSSLLGHKGSASRRSVAMLVDVLEKCAKVLEQSADGMMPKAATDEDKPLG
jgi:hypothetical protein